MAQATTVEQAEPRTVAGKAVQANESVARRAWVSIDSGFATLIAIAALAVAAFSYLNSPIDNLNSRIDSLDAKIEKVSAEVKRYSERTDDKIDRLTDKINELIIEQRSGR